MVATERISKPAIAEAGDSLSSTSAAVSQTDLMRLAARVLDVANQPAQEGGPSTSDLLKLAQQLNRAGINLLTSELPQGVQLPEGMHLAELTPTLLSRAFMKGLQHSARVEEKIIDWSRKDIIDLYINDPAALGVAIVERLPSGKFKTVGVTFGSAEEGNTPKTLATYSPAVHVRTLEELFARRDRFEPATYVLQEGHPPMGRADILFGRLETTYVLPEHRQQGVATALRAAARAQLLAQGEKLGATEVHLYSEVSLYAIETLVNNLKSGGVIRSLEIWPEEQQGLNHYYAIINRDARNPSGPKPAENAEALLRLEGIAVERDRHLRSQFADKTIDKMHFEKELATLRRGVILAPESIAALKELGLLPGDFAYRSYGRDNYVTLTAEDKASLGSYMDKARRAAATDEKKAGPA